jgi:hypothetical protein
MQPDRITRLCEYCGKPFQPPKHNIKLGKGRYCSKPCSNRARTGVHAAHWKGGTHKDPKGYIQQHAPEHPAAKGNGYVMQHRLVMEQIIGRYLTADEVVHHIDGNRANNCPDNLQLMTRGDHTALHRPDRNRKTLGRSE